ncbi:hypothetical protein ACIPQJ_20880 [Streptomyces sp. NPDC090082]|uniref:hypothetical protein n=1 Tax=unclassified Streptomyces TaxID=2593676 RepID=UPI003829C8F5
MHADIHLQLHALTAEELRYEAAAGPRPAGLAPARRVPRVLRALRALRARMGWRLVELGLRMATPANGPSPLAA